MQSTRYDVQYCGRLDHASGNTANKSGTTVEETDVLPWQLLEPTRPDLTTIAKKYALSVAEASIGLTEEGAAEEKRVETWRNGTINKNWPIAEAVKPENWEMIAVVYAQAVVFATEVTALWSQTDPYSHMDKIPFNHDIAADNSYFQVSPSASRLEDVFFAHMCESDPNRRVCGGVPNGFGSET